MNIKDFMKILEEYAPLSISEAFKNSGHHDNSGIIVNSSGSVNKVLLALDLTVDAVKKAVKINADTILTHHPAIYYPISNLDFEGDNESVLLAIKNNINVISMHLNLDGADSGIDHSLAVGLGGNNIKILNYVDETHGYGREFVVSKTTFSSFVEDAVKTFNAVNYMTYGNKDKVVKTVASFCGGGSSDAVKYDGKADVIVTTDMPHHVILSLLNKGKCILLLTHYASEIYGFKKFYDFVNKQIPSYFYDDKKYY